MKPILKKAHISAEAIKKQKEVLIVSHIDADGLTSAGIICKALDRINIDYTPIFLKQLDNYALEKIADINPELVIFTDLGSGYLDEIQSYNLKAIVADHHQPQGKEIKYHLNPMNFGYNGSLEISGSGTTFLLSLELGDNKDLADLAIVGAVGDLQAIKEGKLIGLNREILKIGVSENVLEYKKDLSLFGKQTRPVFKLLQYSTDPYIPGLTGDEDASIEFLRRAGIELKGERWKRWIDLSIVEKQRVVSELINYGLNINMEPYKVQRLVSECYILLREREGTELRDASEYSTLLNATARYEKAEIGLAVCLGEREEVYEYARTLLAEHRRNLVDGLNYVKEKGVIELNNLQYFDAGNKIRETIVGIVAGMSTSIIGNRNLPIIAFANSENGIKVSARGNQDLIKRGLNLAEALNKSANKVGGAGGGHDIAAGATIPFGSKDEFIKELDKIIGGQLKKG